MDPNEDTPPEEQPAPSGEQDDLTDQPQSLIEVNPAQPVLFCDVHLSQRDVRNWSKKDAFRHFYVNWREGMNQVFQFTVRPSIHHTENNDFVYVNAAQSHQTDPSWGFILFNKEKGILSFNIRDGLKLRRYLDQGQLSVSSNNLLKAAMVMTLAGYQVRFESRENQWDFFLSEAGSFCFTRGSSTEGAFLASLNQLSNENAPPEGISAQDLAITIGPGESGTHRRVSHEQLIKWLGITIEITNFAQPRQIICTPYGDLIYDPDFVNRIFINGIQVSNPKVGSFLLGYHFRDDELVSDTGALVLSDNEARLRTLIWETAIGVNVHNAKVFIAFLRVSPGALDVRSVGRFLGNESVKRIWEVLVEDLGTDKIFCQETDDFDEVKRRTNREIAVISSALWSILRAPLLIRTWSEELLYKASPAEPALDTPFAITTKRAFDALLQIDPITANLTITWVDYPLYPPLVHADAKARRMALSKYWLHFICAHTLSPCRLSDLARQTKVRYNYLQCDHIVLAMHSKIVELISQRSCDLTPVYWATAVQKMAAEKLEEMPRCIEVVGDTLDPSRLFVTWELGLSQQTVRFVQSGYHVVLHRGDCVVALTQLVHNGEVDTSSLTAPCGCPQKVVGRQETQATFEGLSPMETHIPFVSLNAKNSIYASVTKPSTPSQPTAASPAQQETDPPEIESIRREHLFKFNENWQKTTFPVLFAQFTPRTGITGSGSELIGAFPPVPVAVLESSRLNFRFERCQYVSVQAHSGVGEGDVEQFILYIHGIHVPGAMNLLHGEGRLTVTAFSFLRTTSLCLFHLGLSSLAQGQGKEDVGLRELLLHYQNFDEMGYRQDAIIFPIESIVSVEAINPATLGPFEAVQYTVDPPDPSRTGYYCRFAVRCNGPPDSAVMMPVASHLLTHSKRWPEPRYISGVPSVIDLTPGCLGPAEGFAQAGARIDAAMGFDSVRDCTWKARYPYTKVYDGRIETVLNDLKRKRLNQPPCDPRSQAPRIILLSLPEREKALQQWDRSLEDAEIFRIMPLIISAFTQRPDFLVLSLPPWILVERAWLELFKGLWTLLISRYAIHMRRVSFTDYGLARDGTMLVIVASCVPTPIPWDTIFATTATTTGKPNPKATVQSVIKDLSFSNPRKTTTEHTTNTTFSTALICKNPQTAADVYNHQTLTYNTPSTNPLPQDHNHTLNTPLSLPRLSTTTHPLTLPPAPHPAGPVFFPFFPAAIRPIPTLPSEYAQPVKNPRGGDLLSVREIARVQGFPDDFVFLGPVGWQRSEVLEAWPVLVGRLVAVGVREVVREFAGVVGVLGMSVGGNGNANLVQGVGAGASTGVSAGANVNANVNLNTGKSANSNAAASTSGQQKQGPAQRGKKRNRES